MIIGHPIQKGDRLAAFTFQHARRRFALQESHGRGQLRDHGFPVGGHGANSLEDADQLPLQLQMVSFTGTSVDLEENAGFKRPAAIARRTVQAGEIAFVVALNHEHRVNQAMNR